MVYDGYLRMGGNEIVNSPRAEGITRSFDCYVPWLVGESCPFLQDAIGDSPYSYANIATAPWYDPSQPELSSRVLGVYGMGFSGVKDSTRQVQVTEGLDDGGVIGSMRKGVRQVRARIAVIAIGDDAMEYARTWLEAALDPDACGQHAEECGTTDVEYLATCPPERAMVPYYSDWALQQTNLLTNPDMETAGAAVVVRTNLITNPAPTSTTGWSAAGATSISYSSGEVTVTTTTAVNDGVYASSAVDGTARPNVSGGMWVNAPSGTALYVEVRANGMSTGAGSVRVNFTATGNWQFVKAENASSASTTGAHQVMVRTASGTAVTFKVKQALIELAPTLLGPYFDGSTQPIVRTNLHPNPAPASSAGYLAVNNATAAYDSASILVTCSPGSADSGVRVHTIPVQPGTPLTISTEIQAVNAGTWRINVQLSGQPVQQVSLPAFTAGETRRVSFTYNPTAAGTAAVYVLRSDTSGSETARVRKVQLEAVSAATPYFDGGSSKAGFAYAWTGGANITPSIEWDADFSTRWAGTANASISELTGLSAVGPASVGGIAFIRSARWKKNGTYSARMVPISTTSNVSYASYPFVGGTVPAGGTVVVTSYQEGPITGSTWAYLGKIYTNPASTTYLTPQRPNAAGEWEQRLTFGAGQTGLILTHGGLAGSGDVWYDLALLTATPNYTGPAFTGRTVPADPLTERFAWTGTADASTSTRETRQLLERPQTDDEYAAVVDPLRRYLHGVAAVSGPTRVDSYRRKRASGDTIVGETLEFTLTAARPWVYGVTKSVDLPSTTPFVVEDVRYNLVKFPSMQLTDGTPVLVGRNYSLNPSVETNATGWSFSQSGAITAPQLTAVRSTELAAVGTASYKVVFTSTTTGTGTMTALQTVALPAAAPLPAVYRFSLNMWAAALATTGTPALSTIAFSVDWLNASSTVLRTDSLGTAPASGGSVTLSNILPPTGATQARVSATVTVSSIASGNVVNLFADALAVTIP